LCTVFVDFVWRGCRVYVCNIFVIICAQDLNRVITKPYTENKDGMSGRPDEVII